jgi:nitroreductase
MDAIQVIETRASVREFSDETIPEAQIKEILRLAGLAPSINNYQPWKFLVIIKRETLHAMADTIVQKIIHMPEQQTRLAKHIKNQAAWYATFFREAPILIGLAGKPYEDVFGRGVQINPEEMDKIRNYPDMQSAGACIQNLLLSAHAKGYGACWMSGPLIAKDELQNMLGITDPWSLITFVAFGEPKDTVSPKPKRNLGDEAVFIQ